MLPKPPSMTTEPSRIPAIASASVCTILLIIAAPVGSCRPKHRCRRAVFGLLERQRDRLADAELAEVAIDNVGQHGRTFRQRHMRDDIGVLGAVHHAEGVDRAFAGGGS